MIKCMYYWLIRECITMFCKCFWQIYSQHCVTGIIKLYAPQHQFHITHWEYLFAGGVLLYVWFSSMSLKKITIEEQTSMRWSGKNYFADFFLLPGPTLKGLVFGNVIRPLPIGLLISFCGLVKPVHTI